jgi:hypothetical protein
MGMGTQLFIQFLASFDNCVECEGSVPLAEDEDIIWSFRFINFLDDRVRSQRRRQVPNFVLVVQANEVTDAACHYGTPNYQQPNTEFVVFLYKLGLLSLQGAAQVANGLLFLCLPALAHQPLSISSKLSSSV